MLEAMLLYFRDKVARPCIGHHDADRFVPFLWTIFFFVLGCNLFGMIPWMGSPTGSLGRYRRPWRSSRSWWSSARA